MIPSILIIAPRGDVGAVALATLLRRRGVCRVSLVDDSDFARHPIILYPESGPPGPQSPTAAGFDAIYCRSATFSAPPFPNKDDADYAASEMHAFGMSWLWTRRHTVINTPSPYALCGHAPTLLVTALKCTDVGLDTPDLLLAVDAARVPRKAQPATARRDWSHPGIPADLDFLPPAEGPPLSSPAAWAADAGPHRWQALVCDDTILDAPPAHEEQLIKLVRALDLEVAEVRLAGTLEQPVVMGVSPIPSLNSAGHLQALATHLERRAQS